MNSSALTAVSPSLNGTTANVPLRTEQPSREASRFEDALQAAKSSLGTSRHGLVQVSRGDTLIGLVKQHAARSGVQLSEQEAMRQALKSAQSSGIQNPNLIFPGQRVDFTTLAARLEARTGTRDAEGPNSMASLDSLTTKTETSTQDALRLRQTAQGGSVLGKTLSRAVDKGYLSKEEQPLVHQRILKLAKDFNFDPDDFAHVAMMESDGLNPRATNGQCHGIIQFCEGPGRGAASVNKQGQAASIRNMSVLQQIDLVEKYLRDVGLDGLSQKVKLDDLYLSVLTPAARAYREPNQALPIAGTQAAALHVNGQRHLPITRTSIVQGLVQNTLDRLDSTRTASNSVNRLSPQALPSGRDEEILTGLATQAARQRRNFAAALPERMDPGLISPPKGSSTGAS